MYWAPGVAMNFNPSSRLVGGTIGEGQKRDLIQHVLWLTVCRQETGRNETTGSLRYGSSRETLTRIKVGSCPCTCKRLAATFHLQSLWMIHSYHVQRRVKACSLQAIQLYHAYLSGMQCTGASEVQVRSSAIRATSNADRRE